MDVRFSITIRQHASLHRVSSRPYPRRTGRPYPTGWTAPPDVAEIDYTPFQSEPAAVPVRLIVRRVKLHARFPTGGSPTTAITASSPTGTGTPGNWRPTIVATPRSRTPSETSSMAWVSTISPRRFAANAAWLAVQVMAHNLARWAARIGLGEQIVTTKTLPAAVLLHRWTAHPLGAAPHPAPSPALALGKPVQSRPHPIASHSLSSLTAPSVPDPLTGQPQGCPANSCQPSPRVPVPACRLANFACRRHCGPPPFHWGGHRPLPSTPSVGIGPGPFAFPYPSSPVSASAVSLRWIRAKARADFDIRWKVALGIEIEDRPFAKSTLQMFRAQLILHDKVREVFESSLRLARARAT